MRRVFVVLVFFVVLCNGFSVRSSLSSHSPYAPQQDPSTYTPPPPTCSPVQMNLVARHGTRNPVTSDVVLLQGLEVTVASILPQIQDTNVTAWMSQWHNEFTIATQGLLVSQGEEEHYGIGKRYAAALPELFPSLDDGYLQPLWPVQTTQIPRTSQSADAFSFGMMEGIGPLPTGFQPVSSFSDSLNEDYMLSFFSICPAYLPLAVSNGAQSTAYAATAFPAIGAGIAQRLGLPAALTTAQVMQVWTGCWTQAAIYNVTDQWCSLFAAEDFPVLEYEQDLTLYWGSGFGRPINYEMAATLFQDIVNQMTNFSMVGNSSVDENTAIAKLRFAHAETVVPIVTLLGLFPDAEQLTATSSPEVIADRNFTGSTVVPFAANTAFVLYRCDGGEYLVRVLHNEKEQVLPVCGGELYCPLNTFLNGYQQYITQYSYASVCDIASPPPAPAPSGAASGPGWGLLAGLCALTGALSIGVTLFIVIICGWCDSCMANRFRREYKPISGSSVN